MTLEPSNGPAQRWALLVTHLTKLAGVVLGLHEGFSTHARTSVLAFAALLVAGAQGVERVLRNLFGNMNGKNGE